MREHPGPAGVANPGRDRNADGELIGSMSHILRVFLIDPQKNIRNIYSPSFLHPDILLSDIRTVTAESGD